MDFDSMVAEVIEITKRPDKQALIESCLKTAATKAHAQAFFYKDILESGVQFTTAGYIQNFNPREIFPRFRKVKYIREWLYDGSSPSHGSPGKFLDWIDIENSIDKYGYMKADVAYMAGQLVQIRSSASMTHALFGAYCFPDVVNTEELEATSFIAREFPYAIIYEAARRVFKATGNKELGDEMTMLRGEEYQLLLVDSDNSPGE